LSLGHGWLARLSITFSTIELMTKDERLALDTAGNSPIFFYNQNRPWGFLSNFSHHSIVMPSPWTGAPVLYKTGEHRYQAMKGSRQAEHDWVVEAADPSQAKDRGRAVRIWPDWGSDRTDRCYLVMTEVVTYKAMAHKRIADTLRGTSDMIYEDSPVDDIWGWRYGNDYRGKNLLGLAWMQVRDYLLT
jgi:ribA/ribD-fused uncharacterized protein